MATGNDKAKCNQAQNVMSKKFSITPEVTSWCTVNSYSKHSLFLNLQLFQSYEFFYMLNPLVRCESNKMPPHYIRETETQTSKHLASRVSEWLVLECSRVFCVCWGGLVVTMETVHQTVPKESLPLTLWGGRRHDFAAPCSFASGACLCGQGAVPPVSTPVRSVQHWPRSQSPEAHT